MMTRFVDFGIHAPESSPCPEILRIIKACEKSADFTIVATTSFASQGDTVILDCVCQEIGTKNAEGIRSRERLAVVFATPVDSENPYSVRALRVGFPFTMHQNSVWEGEPPSLCLYLEPWESLERTWTPESFLRRIQWWLVHAAAGNLHAADQFLEQLFFRSSITVALPRRAGLGVDAAYGLLGLYGEKLQGRNAFVRCLENQVPGAIKSCHVLSLPSVVHGQPMGTPRTLGDLERQLRGRDIGFVAKLRTAIETMIPQAGIPRPAGNDFWVSRSLLVLQIPMKRIAGGDVERVEVRAFVIHAGILDVGVALGVVSNFTPATYYRFQQIGNPTGAGPTEWQQLSITQVEVLEPLDRSQARKMSTIDEHAGGFVGMLAGVGALGSSMALIWAREAWGRWTLVDPDRVKPHNLARHISLDVHIGRSKAETVAELMNQVYPSQAQSHQPVPANADIYLDPGMTDALATFDLIVDASTTLGFPRDLARAGAARRCVSTFLNPLGTTSVLMMEDHDRQIRLDTLEAQYYRSIINEPWGEAHLLGNTSSFSVGSGCRDISVAISNELIQLHGSLLARQIRQKSQHPEASLTIFINDAESGAITPLSIDLFTPVYHERGDWEVLLDSGLVGKLTELRSRSLPFETGGIVAGYKDFKLKRITIVDVLRQPIDSAASPEFFVRGKEGTLEEIQEIRRRTGEIVDYLGEWHSHPDGIDCSPSTTDLNLLKTMGEQASLEGDPFLMVIVCEDRVHPILVLEQE